MAIPVRPVAVGAFRFVLVGLLASILLIGTGLSIAVLVAWFFDGTWNDVQSLTIGTVCMLIIWLFVAVFHLRRETHTMAFSQREQFVIKAKTVLQEMGYALASQQTDALTFRPCFQSYLFGGAIQIALEDQEARLTGPKVSLEFFRRCFRLLNHVQRVQMYLKDQRKITDNVIKRAELQLRLRPDQFEAVRRNVIQLLEKHGAVICELNLLVQSEQGIREDTLEFQVREWLEQNDIEVDIHKDLVQFVEVVHHERETEAVLS